MASATSSRISTQARSGGSTIKSSSSWDLGDDIVRYAVVDGDRSGVWMVRLPPAP